MEEKKSIIIFASGKGTNAEQLMQRFKKHPHIRVALLVCNKSEALVLKIAKEHQVNTYLLNEENFLESDEALEYCQSFSPDLIVLAGFLWKIPQNFIKAFPNKIINLHPALLPKFGGKGMYGMRVHEAVINAGEKESGITLHYVNEVYDEGKIIAQYKCVLDEKDTATSLATKVQKLEHRYYPEAVEGLIREF